ncbi:Asp-tRNA(Asn)/Glu-tRNA(Gln) amidotransferase subunit GatC [Sessilibacter sp. MAH3]
MLNRQVTILDPSEIQKLADLAMIKIDESQITEVAARISDVLALVDELQAADTTGVKPMAHPLDTVQRLRTDEVTEVNHRDEFQAIAPACEDGLYLVPKVID